MLLYEEIQECFTELCQQGTGKVKTKHDIPEGSPG